MGPAGRQFRSGGGRPHTSDANLLDQIDFSLHISNLDWRPNDEEMKRSLFKEFKRFGYISIKILGFGKERRAFINYQHYDEAKRAKKENQHLMLFKRPLHIEWSKSTLIKYPEVGTGRKPTGSTSDSNSFVDDYHPGHGGGAGATRPHKQHHVRGGSVEKSTTSNEHRKRDVSFRTSSKESKPVMPVLDPNATRTLFVGNLELDVTERELRDLFSQYGRIESVDIKVAKSAGTSYSFIKFTTITDAINAKDDMHGRLYGDFHLKIGFGKGSPTGKVWVGGLTCSRDLSEVRHEMDRFGLIRRCDYRDGDNHAYVHFESLEAAQTAVHALQNFRLRNGQLVKLDIHKPLHLREVDEDFIVPPSPPPPPPPSGNNPSGRHRQSGGDIDKHHTRREPDFDKGGFDEMHHHHHHHHHGRDRVVNKLDERNYRKRSRNSDATHQQDVVYNESEYSSNTKRRAMDFNESNGKNTKEYHHHHHHHSKNKNRSNSIDGRRSKHDHHHERASSLDGQKRHSASMQDTNNNGDTERNVPNNSTNGDDLHNSLTAEAVASSSTMMVEGDTALKLTDSTEPVSPDSDSKGVKPDSTHTETLSELGKSYPVAWRGNLVLKNTGFPARLHLIGGDPSVAEYLLRGKDEPNILRITQRLRLEQPRLEEVNKRLSIAGPSGHCILFALPGSTVNHSTNNSPDETDGNMQLRPLRSLVSYLKQKEAAGIVALNAADIGDTNDGKDPKEVIGVLHAFPPCDFSQSQLIKVIPTLSLEPSREDHIVVLLVKGNV
jgi:RNA-binding protein 15